MNNKNLNVLTNIIGAVETGGQVYGKKRYNDYTPPYKNTPNEHTITLGWAQNYGAEAERLIHLIYDTDKSTFFRYDTASPSISSMLGKDWVTMRWNPNESQKQSLINLISSDIGKQCQDYLFINLMEQFIADCERDYTNDIPAQMMYCEIRHLGGKKSADRIFKRCNGDFSLHNILNSLKQDQYDYSSNNQVGDKLFWSRHEKCVEFINKYAEKETDEMDALTKAKIMLYQPLNDVMTGYTPDGKQCFVDAGAWYKTPKKGDIIYYYSSAKGRVGHVGIVEDVNESIKIVYTIEGNTSFNAYAENGGCVARHTYEYNHIGGTYRINGFGRPNFEAVGVTADDFVNTAVSQLGYLEKKSNKDLDNKIANAGSNNYQKFQRDVGAGNGDQWCQYFVDAIALYTCQGKSIPVITNNIGEGQQWLNDHYSEILLKYCGALLDVDNEYGPKSRAAALAVWKFTVNQRFGANLTPSNTNFGNSCKEFGNLAAVNYGDTGVFVYICQFILSAHNLYKKGMDGDCGEGTVEAIKEFQRLHNLELDGSCGANTWYELFN